MKKDDFVYKELKTQLNRLKFIEAAVSGTAPEGFLPRRVFIEPTNSCNCRCVHCPTHTQMERPRGQMDFGLYTRIIDELAPHWAEITVNLYKHGEPTLHPRIFDMVDYARERNLFVQMNTNLAAIRPEHIPALKRVDYLGVSIDAASPETYRAVKGRGHFEQVIGNFLDFLEAWGEGATSAAYACDAVFLRQQANDHEAALFEEMFTRLPIGHVSVFALHNFTGPIGEGATGLEGKAALPRGQWPVCNIPWDIMGIDWDGTAMPCTIDCNTGYPLGNVAEEGVLALWEGPRMAAFRDALRRRDYESLQGGRALCAGCSILWEPAYALPTDFHAEVGRMEKYLTAAVRRVAEQKERHGELMAKWEYLKANRQAWTRELRERAEALRPEGLGKEAAP
ncbi:radical SAM protein [Fundidesulfovibrio soli]|uniref:radical SAM protein n=1 Tax=Fundidesulfovibrio soli TaxID=2922716 RepID=UPI001FAE9C2A